MDVKRTNQGGWRSFFGLDANRRDLKTSDANTSAAVTVAESSGGAANAGAGDVPAEAGAFGQVPNAPLPVNGAGEQASANGAQLEAASKPWQTRLDASKKEDALLIAQATLAIMGGVSPAILVEPIKSAALAMVKDDAQPGHDAAAMKRVVQRCLKELHPDAIKDALLQLVVAVTDAALSEVAPAPHKDEIPNGKDDTRDWHRTWGLRLLPDDDAAFRDPDYLVALLQESQGIRATTNEGRTSITQARERFNDEWQKLAPNTKLLAFAESGSDSVSLCFQIATVCGRRRSNNPKASPTMAFFQGVYGGGRGLASSMNFAGWGRFSAQSKEAVALPACTSMSKHPKGAELARVQAEEQAALAQLEQQANNDNPPLGAIFLEVIQGANSVRFYRPEFLLAVRALADKHAIPLICDEVLTGGGRTGKMFAYEHIQGFKPDFVVFGKGLQTSGIAQVHRPEAQTYSQGLHKDDLGITTAGGDAVRFLKGAQVMKRIREGGLMENAAEVGAYLEQRLREVQKFHKLPIDCDGVGLILGMSKVDGAKYEVSNAWGHTRTRYLPPLTLSKADVDAVISDLLKTLPREAVRELQDRRAEQVRALAEVEARTDLTPESKRNWMLNIQGFIARIDADLQKLGAS
jgi:4-aminobutyrate aminotransferase-like enzyme